MIATKTAPISQPTTPKFSIDECRLVAAEYDGTPQSIDRLMAQWGPHKTGLNRRQITRAAVRGGYKTTSTRRPWSIEDNKWLLQNWSTLSDHELAAKLKRSSGAIQQQYRRLRVDADDRAKPRFSLGALHKLTGIDPRDWRVFIALGWLDAEQRQLCEGIRHPTYVTAETVRALLGAHPEAYDYEHAGDEARQALALCQLPPPPRYKLVTCRSRPCSRQGGTSFWAVIYETPNCPRCGRLTSRLSQGAQYRSDLDPASVNWSG
jgi:hypothetical protein